jgi:hypothetical protein
MIARMLNVFLVLALAAFAAAAPTKRTTLTKNFYLLASPTKSTTAANATGLNLVDPFYQANYLLRAQPQAASYNAFNLTGCVLSSASAMRRC